MGRPLRPLVRLLPGAAFLSYLVGTVVLFYVGPWRYEVAADGKLLAFLVTVHLALAAGYLAAAFSSPRPARLPLPIAKIALGCILLDLAILLPLSAHNTGSWIPPVWRALGDLDGAYRATLHLQSHQVPYVNYVRILVAPLLAAAVPLGIVYWRRLATYTKLALIVLVTGTLALFVSMGMNRALGEWAILFPWFVAAGHFSGLLRLRGRQWVAAIGIALLNASIFFVFFGATMNARQGSSARWGSMGSIQATSRLIAPGSEAATTVSPSPTLVAINGLSSYVTQGYYAVALALEEPFLPMWGVGHSTFLTRQAVRLTGDTSLLERPYPVRIEQHGWMASAYWATIYPWLASDVGFPGVVVVVFLIGYLLARVWVDLLGGRNPLAVVLFGQLVLMLYYFPGHNRVLQIGEGVSAFWGLLLLWWLGSSGLLERLSGWWSRRRRRPGEERGAVA